MRPSLLLAWFISVPTAHATTVAVVAPGSSVQDAIATVGDGGLVILEPGAHVGCAFIANNVDITMVGAGPDSTTLTCNDPALRTLAVNGVAHVRGVKLIAGSSGGVVLVSVGELQLEDVEIQSIPFTASVDGVGIDAVGSDIVLRDVNIYQTLAPTNGGGIRADGGSLDMTRVTIDNAFAGVEGGGLWALGVDIVAHEVDVRTSSAILGGGVWTSGMNTEVEWHGGIVANNSAYAGSGGGWYTAGGANVNIYGTLFENNTATAKGGAIAGSGLSTVTLVGGATFEGNHADRHGGAFYGASGTHTFAVSSFNRNTADGLLWIDRFKNGGAIYVAGGTVTTNGNSFESHESVFILGIAGSGGAVYVDDGTYRSTGDYFGSNISGRGGAIYVGPDADDVTLEYSTFSKNSANFSEGGAVYFGDSPSVDTYGLEFDSNTAVTFGGAAYHEAGSLVYHYGTYATGNSATWGGAMAVGKDAILVIRSSDFDGNSATWNGGALDHETFGTSFALIDVAGTHFRNNAALNAGGGIALSSGQLILNGSWIVDNDAPFGGGMFNTLTEYSVVEGTTFCSNEAVTGGGVFMDLSEGYRSFDNSVFQENLATGTAGGFYENGKKDSGSFYYTYMNWVTFAGNTVAGNAQDGVVVNGSAPSISEISAVSSVFTTYSLSDSVVSVTPDFAANEFSIDYYGSHLWSASGVPLYNIQDWTELYSNVDDFDPQLEGWTSTDNCLTESLDSLTSSHRGGSVYGYYGDGVGAGVTGLWVDVDADGWSVGEGDCDDKDGGRHPGRAEIAGDGIDQDCTGWDDPDPDGDGSFGIDCNEGDPSVYPAAPDTWYDGIDSNCDEANDFDQDGDGIPSPDDCNDLDAAISPVAVEVPYDGTIQRCGALDGDADLDGHEALAMGGTDCDDLNSGVHPGEPEVWYDGIDADCLGDDDFDRDHDGDPIPPMGGDCDDQDDKQSSLILEIPYDGIDNDCVGGDLTDVDADGFDAIVAGGEDCDDDQADTYPGAEELLDGRDNDCDGEGDADADADGILDYFEGLYGTNVNDDDSDADGIPDGIEWGPDPLGAPVDTDDDGQADALDDDSDGDGLSDAEEGMVDTDGDGTIDAADSDDDGDGMPTIEEAPGVDSDGDGLLDSLDPDSDNDGSLDGRDAAPLDDGADGAADPPADSERNYGFGLGCTTTGQGTGWLGLAALLARRRRNR